MIGNNNVLRNPAPRCSLWRATWGVRYHAVVLALLASVTGTALIDLPASIAWQQLHRLPSINYLAEAQSLLQQEQFGLARVYVQEGLQDEAYAREHREALLALWERIGQAEASWARRAREIAKGILTGRGTSPEAIAAALASDLLVIGDVRDLAIEGYHLVTGQEVDELIVVLSAVGIATTVLPHVDLGAAIAKVAIKMARISRRLLHRLILLARQGENGLKALQRFASHVGTIAKRANGETALLALRHAEDPQDIVRLARASERLGPRTGFALRQLGREGVHQLRRLPAGSEDVLVTVARKGEAGRRWLASPTARFLLHPHPLLGLFKGWAKGHVQHLLTWSLQSLLRPWGWVIVPSGVLACWIVWRRLLKRWYDLRSGGRLQTAL